MGLWIRQSETSIKYKIPIICIRETHHRYRYKLTINMAHGAFQRIFQRDSFFAITTNKWKTFHRAQSTCFQHASVLSRNFQGEIYTLHYHINHLIKLLFNQTMTKVNVESTQAHTLCFLMFLYIKCTEFQSS